MAIVSAPLGFKEAVLCGTGATSRVYRAVEGRSGRVVALKRLHRQLVKSADALARLRRELEALSALRHPAIVPVYDIVKWEGDPTLVMAFIDGQDLKERIVERGPLEAGEAARVMRSLFDALAAAHGAGIVHRDVKPQNVRLDTHGKVYLLDFGSARLDAASALTKTGSTVGTPEYMPPELFGGPVYDPRTDIYGVGATIFEAVTGRPPQSADSLAELAFLRAEIPITPVRAARADVPEALAQVVDRCLSIRPDDRFATASLAVWALDHPKEERAFALRRSRLPLCLHCQTPLPPRSRTCPACKRAPFGWSDGRFHVVLDSVESSSRLLEHLATISPEHGAPGELTQLAKHTAALSFQKPRVVSFVSEVDARRITEGLVAVGAHAHVEEESSRWVGFVRAATVVLGGFGLLGGLAAGGALGGLTGALTFVAPGIGILALERISSLLRARGSILAPSKLPKSLWTNLEIRAAGLAALGLGLGLFGFWSAFDLLTFPGASLLAVASAALTATLSVVLGVPTRVKKGPVPSRSARFFAALSVLTGSSKREEDVGPRKQPSKLTSFGLAVLLFALVPYELFALSGMWESLVGLPVYASATWSSKAVRARIAAQTAESATAAGAVTAASAAATSVGVLTTVAPIAVGGASPVLMLLAAARLARRRRQVLRDGATIEAELGDGVRRRLAERTTPEPDAAMPARLDRLAQLPAGDAFVKDALVRATDLAHALAPDDAEALTQALAALSDGRGSMDEALAARCILETDPSHELRFKLLALEGELEAKAAADWVESIAEPKRHE
ncbi:MAG: serine/threonine protein kinase [Deltaproteobacteria bacterium]|nr:serine/threonine protein kinase [Deltaproteobacteria bacterium]